jgi:VIT1/CCC1 family predicted Fe2+/Mn2+ transporter
MSSKLERDIEEVLAKIDRFPPKRSLWSRVRRRLGDALDRVGGAVGGLPRPRVRVGQVLLFGIALIVIAYVFGDSLGGSLVRLVVIAAIVLFIGAFIFSLRRQSASRLPEKRWRGQPMDMDQPHGTGSWWKRWRSRR